MNEIFMSKLFTTFVTGFVFAFVQLRGKLTMCRNMKKKKVEKTGEIMKS